MALINTLFSERGPHSAPKLSQGAARGATEVNENEEKAIKRRRAAF
jgi:hypothetical protein